MPERPLLITLAPTRSEARTKRRGFPSRIETPDTDTQISRLDPRFERIQKKQEKLEASLQSDSSGLVPEQVLVLETVIPIQNLVPALKKAGIELLGELENDIDTTDSAFAKKTSSAQDEGKQSFTGVHFLCFTNQQSLRKLLSRWQTWKSGEDFKDNGAAWRDLFLNLNDLRSWGVRDRLEETGVLEDWKERVKANQEMIPCEVELWFREERINRERARDRVRQHVKDCRGEVLNEVCLDKIRYHVLLCRIPIQTVEELLSQSDKNRAYEDIELVQCEQIQYIRASGQMVGDIVADEGQSDHFFVSGDPHTLRSPVVALLDGFPVQNHQGLVNRLIIDDPEAIESQYRVVDRCHGTAMASLILHGDLDEQGSESLQRKLYVRPILQPDPQHHISPLLEVVPDTVLPVDRIHSAVRDIFQGNKSRQAAASRICVINLSFGIRGRVFHNEMSPLARLLDWLAWEYDVLFIVSAGNHTHPLKMIPPDGDFASLSIQEREKCLLQSCALDTRNRRLLSPAEAMNVLTVAATHEDSSKKQQLREDITDRFELFDPFVSKNLPSLFNAHGLGFQRAVKPELLAPGGKVLLRQCLGTDKSNEYEFVLNAAAPGQKIATPGQSINVNSTCYARGTSNATAIISRYASILYDVLEERFNDSDLPSDPEGKVWNGVPRALWLKTLLVHGASWGEDVETVFTEALKNESNSRTFRAYLSRFLGYGSVEIERLKQCTQSRVTILSGGKLRPERAHAHLIPFPESLDQAARQLRITITLSWFTPVDPALKLSRQAKLWFELIDYQKFEVKRKEANWQAVRRGTVQHEVFEGEANEETSDATVFGIKVNCDSPNKKDSEDEIPYALATTIEAKEEIEADIYEEVRVKLQQSRAQVRI